MKYFLYYYYYRGTNEKIYINKLIFVWIQLATEVQERMFIVGREQPVYISLIFIDIVIRIRDGINRKVEVCQDSLQRHVARTTVGPRMNHEARRAIFIYVYAALACTQYITFTSHLTQETSSKLYKIRSHATIYFI